MESIIKLVNESSNDKDSANQQDQIIGMNDSFENPNIEIFSQDDIELEASDEEKDVEFLNVESDGWRIVEILKENDVSSEFDYQKYWPNIRFIPQSPIEIFSLFFNHNVFEEITNQTNLNSLQNKKDAEKITIQEVKAYIEILILMGIIHLPSTRDYWSSDEVLTNYIKTIMSRNKYDEINSVFHLNDNNQIYKSDPLLSKIALLLGITNGFSNFFNPGQEITIDESVIPFYGRSNFMVYNPLKPDKWGYKVFMLCDSFSGYCLDMEIYYGKPFSEKYKSMYGTKFSKAIVLHLLTNYKGKNHILFIDNYYTSLSLSISLCENKIFTTGTIKFEKK